MRKYMTWIALGLFLLSSLSWAQECNTFLDEHHFREAFSSSVIKQGTLIDRMQGLVNKYPNRIKIIDNVIMKFEDPGGSGSMRRKVVVMSVKDLQDEPLMKDYLDAMSWDAVSFPLGQGAGHLYTRVGSKTLDYIGSASMNEYRFSSYSERLETFVSLSDSEFSRLRTYIQNARENNSAVLGPFDMQGANQAQGRLDCNLPIGAAGHNCTSWMALAPIGDRGETLKSLVGASWDVHRNPGWWSAYLQTKVSERRVPFVIYMSDSSLDDILQKVKPNTILEWNYGLH